MKIKRLSSLAKVFPETEPAYSEFTAFTALQNETFSFQLALSPEKKSEENVFVSVSSRLCELSLFTVEQIPSGLSAYDDHDDFYFDTERSAYPDLLLPTDGALHLTKGEWSSVWVRCVPKNPRPGKTRITLTMTFAKETVTTGFSLEIVGADLPEQELLYTNWFHNDCLCTYYGFEPFSKDYWRTAENYIRNAVQHGMNMILTPVFTPPLDTAVGGERSTVQLVGVTAEKGKYAFDFSNFEKYIELCLSCGIKAFEISHLFTQWGAKNAPKIMAQVDGETKRIFGWETDACGEEYADFLTSFSKAFEKKVKKLGIKEKCYLHVSDEPSLEQMPDYRRASALMHRLFSGYHYFDALSEIEYYREGLIDTPVCGEQEADLFRSEVKRFWTYYCCGQGREYLPNRLFSMPSIRNRMTGLLLYLYDAEGFLQWGHNFWYTKSSLRSVDPFTETDAGGAFPSGDAFVVYPGENGKPLNSLRHEVFFDGIEDLRALRLLETLSSREFVTALLQEDVEIKLSMKNYPHDCFWLLSVRQKINREIQRRI